MENAIEFLRSFRSKARESASAKLSELPQMADDKCREMYMNAVQEVNKRYLPGTISYVSQHHPDLDRQIDESESTVKDIWLAVERGKATIEELRAAVALWYRLNLKAIKLYSEEGARNA